MWYFQDNKELLVIEGSCYETLPCSHDVWLNNKKISMMPTKIIEWLRQHNFKIPKHFEYAVNM